MAADLKALLRRLRLDRTLAAHDPALVGARALQLRGDGPVVILCRSGRGFADRLRAVYGSQSGFTLMEGEGMVGCTFTMMDTPVQIVGRAEPVRRQEAFRRFQLCVRLLRLIGTPLAEQVRPALARGRTADAVFAAAMGVEDLLRLERTPPMGLRQTWQEARRQPAPRPTAPSTPIPEPDADPDAEDEDDLLRQPDPLLKERRVTWLDPGRMLPVNRQDLPAPKRKASQPPPRLPKKP